MEVNHVAIILDGNRRWAKSKNMIPQLGHREGAKNLENFAIEANKMGLKYLTVYVFSTENWKRSKEEVGYLMKLFHIYFARLKKRLSKYNMKIKFLGIDENVEEKILKEKKESEELSKDATGLQLNICFNYGGRREITDAAKKIAQKVLDGKLKIDEITEEVFANNLYTAGIPDPDILIRTSGEQRLSNFLPWQLTYTEFFFVEKHWPEFSIEDLKDVLEQYKNRDRRFGGK